MSEDWHKDLSALLQQPAEEPHIEYKSWIDITDASNKAKIAKHICAIANYGGGYIVFGIGDDGKSSGECPYAMEMYKQDAINNLVQRYLTPPIHCKVNIAVGPEAHKHPVVLIPPHGAQPICAKADGPEKDGKPVGIRIGVHYTRVPGPKSEPVNNPALWQPILRRCVLQERDTLLSAIHGILEKPKFEERTSFFTAIYDDLLSAWSQNQPTFDTEPLLANNRAAFYFQIRRDSGDALPEIPLDQLPHIVRQAAFEAEKFAQCEISAFEAIDDRRYRTVTLLDSFEGYKIQHVYEEGSLLIPTVLSQIYGNGFGGEVRAYWEDSDWVKGAVEKRSSQQWEPGQKLSPRFQITRVANFIAFVRSFARAFSDAHNVVLGADYSGVEGRTLDDPRAMSFMRGSRQASIGRRNCQTSAEILSLSDHEIVKLALELTNPMFRLFDGFQVDEHKAAEYLKIT